MATETIGRRLRRLRTSKNISQDQLAEALRTTRQTVSNWENDKNAIDYFSLEDIKKILHVSWDELMADDYEEMLKRHLANVDAMSDGEKYVEKSLQHGCRWPYTDIANLSKPGDITITADDLRIAYRTASDALIHIAVAIEAKNVGFIILDVNYIGFRIRLEDEKKVKQFKQYLDELFVTYSYEHRPRFDLIAQAYNADYHTAMDQISKKAAREAFDLKGEQIYRVLSPQGYTYGCTDNKEDAKKLANKLKVEDYKVVLD